MFEFLSKTAYTFEGKKEQEIVVLFLHRHWYTLVKKITILMVLALLPILALIVLGQIILANEMIPLFTFLWAAYMMALWYYLFYALTMYTLDYWIVTNERIVNNIQQGFFNRKISEVSIHMVQDVSVKLSGVIPTMLNFGFVEIQTAAEISHFLLEEVPNPQVAKDKIMEIIEKTEDEAGQRMYGLTRRHKFHPQPYNNYVNEIQSNDSQKASNIENLGTNTKEETETQPPVKENNIPPNLPV
jgi:hypothetical protein